MDDENIGQQFSFNDVLYLTRETQNDVNQEYSKTLTFASSTGGLGELGGLSSIQVYYFEFTLEYDIWIQVSKPEK